MLGLVGRVFAALILAGVGVGFAVASDGGSRPDAAVSSAGEAAMRATAWPSVLPCPSPRTLLADGRCKSQPCLTWSSRDGASTVSFAPKHAEGRDGWMHLDGRFPVGRLEWLASGSNGPQLLCRRTKGDFWSPKSDDDQGEASIAWSCDARSCETEATYIIARAPEFPLTQRWTEPKRGFDWAEGKPRASAPRFVREISTGGGRADEFDQATLAMTRDLLRDLREAIGLACATKACAPRVHAADRVLAGIVGDPTAISKRLDHDTSKPEPFGHAYAWKVTSKGATVEVSCETHTGGLSVQIDCWKVEVDLGSDKFVQERTRIVLAQPRGQIDFGWKPPFARISGAALAVRPVAPR